MKLESTRPWMAYLSNRYCYVTIFFLLNIFVASTSFASGSKLPEIADGQSVGSSGNFNTGSTDVSSFKSPWKNSETSIVIDAYEGNSIDWNKMDTDKKVTAVIHRSSIGTRVDGQYQARKKLAREHGYLWGAYHLGTRGNTIAQADFFISLVGDDPDTMMFLDLEDTSAGNFMSLDEAMVFMNYVYEKTGRILAVYANHATTVLLNQKVKNNPLFQQSKLWYARYKSTLTDYPGGIWPNYFLWQFSSELNCSSTGSCLYNVPGTTSSMDVNVFNGSANELASQWNNN